MWVTEIKKNVNKHTQKKIPELLKKHQASDDTKPQWTEDRARAWSIFINKIVSLPEVTKTNQTSFSILDERR